jgi:hypothetical protein
MPSGQSSWLQLQRSGFDSRRYHIFWEVVGLEQGPLSLMSTTEEPVERNSSGSGLENRGYGRRGSTSLTTEKLLYPEKLTLASPTNGLADFGHGLCFFCFFITLLYVIHTGIFCCVKYKSVFYTFSKCFLSILIVPLTPMLTLSL